MKRILVTTDFCKCSRYLVDHNCNDDLNKLRTVLILLSNDKPLPKKYRDHQLTNSPFRELHISGDVLLLYRHEVNNSSLVVSLVLINITNHKKLNKDASRSDYTYKEVSTQDLHDITSAININQTTDLDGQELVDLLESISDYASTDKGYILLSDYYFEGNEIHCLYDYYLYKDDSYVADSIDFIIDLDAYHVRYIYELNKYIDRFIALVKQAFNE